MEGAAAGDGGAGAGAGGRPSLQSVRPVAKSSAGGAALGRALAELAAGRGSPPAGPPGRRGLEPLPEVDAFVLEGVLSRAQCAALVGATEASGYSFWNPDAAADYRNAHTVEAHSPDLAAYVWGRIRDQVVPLVEFTTGQGRWERGTEGQWRACGVNEHMLFARYREGGHFSPHTDGYTVIDFNRRSLYTLLIYLNDCPSGGRTRLFHVPGEEETVEFHVDASGRFRWPEGRVTCSAPVAAGSCLVFFQDIPHEGEPVGAGGEKYLIRSDVMYKRAPAVCDSERDREAYRLFREAEVMEGDGNPAGAVGLYQRAMKLSPELAEVFGYR